MDLLFVVLLHITYLSFLGCATGTMEETLATRKKWNFLGMNRVKRDLQDASQRPFQSNDATLPLAFIKPEDVKDSLVPQSSNGAHIRVKRYRHSFSNYPQITSRGCKFGTCIVHNLANQIYQYTDKDKDSTAPARKLSSHGYGRRRRSIPERRLLLTAVNGKIKPWWVSTGKTQSRPGAQEQILDNIRTSVSDRGSLSKVKGKMWQTLLRT